MPKNNDMENKEMKTYSLDEVTDKYIAKKR